MLLRKRKEKDFQSSKNNINMGTLTTSSKRRSQKLPIYLVILLCLVAIIAYYTFSMPTIDIVRNNDFEEFAVNTHNVISNIDDSNNDISQEKGSTGNGGIEVKEGGVRGNSNEKDSSHLEDETGTVETKARTDCKSFEHGDTSPTEDVESIFNCNSEYGNCKWHYPAKFFDAECGIGKDYVDQVEVLKKLHAERQLWLNGPPIVIPWASITPRVVKSKFHPEPFPTHNISMTHVHKTGGTSLVNAFGQILSRKAKGMRYTVYLPDKTGPKTTRFPPNTQKILERKNITINAHNPRTERVSNFLNGAVKYRSEWGPNDHTLFAVIRDPAERFISAIGQATGAFGSSANGVGKKLLKECVKATSKETLSCFVNLVQNNSTLVEVHFTPMVLEISFATMWKDIPVAVFPFEAVPALMHELGADPKSKRKDGHKKGYRKDPILTNMTSADYTHDSLIQLCEIYMMDVLFLNHLGYPTTCDPMLEQS